MSLIDDIGAWYAHLVFCRAIVAYGFPNIKSALECDHDFVGSKIKEVSEYVCQMQLDSYTLDQDINAVIETKNACLELMLNILEQLNVCCDLSEVKWIDCIRHDVKALISQRELEKELGL